MNGDGNKKATEDYALQKLETSNQKSLQYQAVQKRNLERSFMEAEGRGYSGLFKNSSEEIFLKSWIDSSMGMAAPSLEMLGLKKISQTLRADSEELFNSWLMNGEIPGFSLTNTTHRTRQASQRISTELAALSCQQHGVASQNKSSNDNPFQQNISTPDELSNDLNQHSLRNALEKGMQSNNLYLAKAWFQSTQPMTRSRSSELRRRYAAMQNFQIPQVVEAPHNMSGRDINRMKQEFVTSSFCDLPADEIPKQSQMFMSPSNSYTSPVNSPPLTTVDAVSSVVSMLKGTIERKKLINQSEKEIVHGSSFGFYGAPEVQTGLTSDQGAMNQILMSPGTFHAVSSVQVNDLDCLQRVEGSVDLTIEGYVAPANQTLMGTVSQERSQSESSAAAPVLSAGFEVCDGPTNSGQTLSVCESSRRHVGNGSSENGSKAKDFRERIFENNFKDDRKKGHLIRMGSASSGGSVDRGDPTKKRRVERSRKMAEAKERNSAPTIPSDMQSVLKRCENLEKEVRSLKLNLSFMNRKDSEQTKQIEELQKQNEELTDEKERLLEEIERIVSDPSGM